MGLCQRPGSWGTNQGGGFSPILLSCITINTAMRILKLLPVLISLSCFTAKAAAQCGFGMGYSQTWDYNGISFYFKGNVKAEDKQRIAQYFMDKGWMNNSYGDRSNKCVHVAGKKELTVTIVLRNDVYETHTADDIRIQLFGMAVGISDQVNKKVTVVGRTADRKHEARSE